jgi:6-phosphogluconolactonase
MSVMKTAPERSTGLLASWMASIAMLLLVFACGARAGEGPVNTTQSNRQVLVEVGTYTGPKSKGIYSFRLEVASGAATAPQLAAETESPSFLALHPGGRLLYAANETAKGGVSAFALDRESGKLTFLNRETSAGDDPCHLVVDKTGKHVLVANYSSGTVAVLPIAEDGRVGSPTTRIQQAGSGPNAGRQKAAHAHCVRLDARNGMAWVADLGADRLVAYRYTLATGGLVPEPSLDARLPPGSGPRHIAIAPGERFVYSINELDCTVTSFTRDDKSGGLKMLGTLSTLPGNREKDFSTAEVEVHPSGKFLYGSNRGHGSIAVFAIDSATGALKPVEHRALGGKTPRSFAIDPTGRVLLAASQDADLIEVFRIDFQTGRLSPAGEPIRVPAPVCVLFVPAG